jgi:thioredoxin 2
MEYSQILDRLAAAIGIRLADRPSRGCRTPFYNVQRRLTDGGIDFLAANDDNIRNEVRMKMVNEQMIIRCLNCGTRNRIKRDRVHDRPTCGRCHAHLDDMIIRCLSCGTKNRMPETRLSERPLCGKCGVPLVIGTGEGRPIDITDETFSREVLSHAGSVLMDLWAPWCAPCRTIGPILEELAAKYAGGIKVVKLNIDENPLTASKYDVRNIPTMLLFKDGNLENRLVGALPKEEIERHLLASMKTT